MLTPRFLMGWLVLLAMLFFSPPSMAQTMQLPDRAFGITLSGSPVILRDADKIQPGVSIIRMGRKDDTPALWQALPRGDGIILVDASTGHGALQAGETVAKGVYTLRFVEDLAQGTVWSIEPTNFEESSLFRLFANVRRTDGTKVPTRLELGSGYPSNRPGVVMEDIFGLYIGGQDRSGFDITVPGARRAVIEFSKAMFYRGLFNGPALDLDPTQGLIFGLNTSERTWNLGNLEPITAPYTYGTLLPDDIPLPLSITLGHVGDLPLDVHSVYVEELGADRERLWQTKPLLIVSPGQKNVRRFPQDNAEVLTGGCVEGTQPVLIATEAREDAYLSTHIGQALGPTMQFDRHVNGNALEEITFCAQTVTHDGTEAYRFTYAKNPRLYVSISSGLLLPRRPAYAEYANPSARAKFEAASTFFLLDRRHPEDRVRLEEALAPGANPVMLAPASNPDLVLRDTFDDASHEDANGHKDPRSNSAFVSSGSILGLGITQSSREVRILTPLKVNLEPLASGPDRVSRIFVRDGLQGTALTVERWNVKDNALVIESRRSGYGPGADLEIEHAPGDSYPRIATELRSEGYLMERFQTGLDGSGQLSVPYKRLADGFEPFARHARPGQEDIFWRPLDINDGTAFTKAVCDLVAGAGVQRLRIDLSLDVQEISSCERSALCIGSGSNLGREAEWYGTANFRLFDRVRGRFLTPVAVQTNRGLTRNRSATDKDLMFEKDDDEDEVMRISLATKPLHAYKVYDVPDGAIGNIEIVVPSMTLWEDDGINDTQLDPVSVIANDDDTIRNAPLNALLDDGVHAYRFEDKRLAGAVVDAAEYRLEATPVCGGHHLYDPKASGVVLNLTDETQHGLILVREPPRPNDINRGPGSTIGGGIYGVGFEVPPMQEYAFDMVQIDLSKAYSSLTQVKNGRLIAALIYHDKTERDADLKVIENRVTAGYLRTIADLLTSAGGGAARTQLNSSTYSLAAGVTSNFAKTFVTDPLVSEVQKDLDAAEADKVAEDQLQAIIDHLREATRDKKEDAMQLAAGCAPSTDGRIILLGEDRFDCLPGSLETAYGTPRLCGIIDQMETDGWERSEAPPAIQAYLAGCH